MKVGIKEAAEILGVSVETLRRWDRSGKFRAERHPLNRYRMYDAVKVEALASSLRDRGPSAADRISSGAERATTLIGRRDVVRAIHRLFAAQARLITLVGPPGIGKTYIATRLDLSALSALPFVLDFSETTSLSDVCDALERGLSIRFPEHEIAACIDYLGKVLREQANIVLVLDNIEHLLPSITTAIEKLLALAPHLRIVATTREPLRIAREHVVPIEPLQVPEERHYELEQFTLLDSVALFFERVRYARPTFTPTAEIIPIVARIIRMLDGIPLALELAAARCDVMSFEEIASRLEQSLVVLSYVDLRARSTRHGTMEAAIDWSWRLLSEVERSALVQATHFVGGFDLQAAQQIIELGEEARVEDALHGLVSRGLLVSSDTTSSEIPRFRMLFVIRQFALARGTEDHLGAAVAQRHTLYFGSEPGASPVTVDSTLSTVAIERGNLVVAATSVRPDDDSPPPLVHAAITAAIRLARLIDVYGPSRELTFVLDHAVALCEAKRIAGAKLAHVLAWRARLAYARGSIDTARDDASRAARLAAGAHDVQGQVMAGCILASCAALCGDTQRAHEVLRGLAGAMQPATDRWLTAAYASNLARLALLTGELPRAVAEAERAAQLAREADDRIMEGHAIAILARIAQEAGDHVTAFDRYSEALEILREANALPSQAIVRGYLATLLHERRDNKNALHTYLESLQELAASRFRGYHALFLGGMGALLARLDEPRRARESLADACALAKDCNDPTLNAVLALHQGHLDLHRARRAAAVGGDERHHLAAAKRRLETSEAVLNEDYRWALRLLTEECSVLEEGTTPINHGSLRISLNATWFEAVRGQRVSLEKRPILRKLLHRLLEARLTSPSVPLSATTLLNDVWSTSDDEPAAAHRLRVAIYALRREGLQNVLLSDVGGYVLDSSIPIEIV